MKKSVGNLCSSTVMLVLLIILLTIIVVHIALNSYNKEMFLNYNQKIQNGNLFTSNLLNQNLQNKVNKINEQNPSSADNALLSRRHLKNVFEVRRPELIKNNKESAAKKLCYVNL